VWRLFPETLDVFSALRQKKIPIGIVSNWDSRLFSICDGLRLTGLMNFVVASAAFGASKPDRRIFEEALRLAAVRPAEGLHVGDSVENDCRGAEGAGMGAVLIDRKNRHGEWPRKITTLESVLEMVE
jgi:putative hydrolase of the HAD superfamily